MQTNDSILYEDIKGISSFFPAFVLVLYAVLKSQLHIDLTFSLSLFITCFKTQLFSHKDIFTKNSFRLSFKVISVSTSVVYNVQISL